MHSKDFLAQELRKADLDEMALKAEKGEYHDFLSPHALPEMMLDKELLEADTAAASALRERHHKGEFDATLQESEEWVNSPEGQEAFAMLMRKD